MTQKSSNMKIRPKWDLRLWSSQYTNGNTKKQIYIVAGKPVSGTAMFFFFLTTAYDWTKNVKYYFLKKKQ